MLNCYAVRNSSFAVVRITFSIEVLMRVHALSVQMRKYKYCCPSGLQEFQDKEDICTLATRINSLGELLSYEQEYQL